MGNSDQLQLSEDYYNNNPRIYGYNRSFMNKNYGVGYNDTQYDPYDTFGTFSFYQYQMENNPFLTMDDGFDPYSTERYAREIGLDQIRINTCQGEYAKYRDVQPTPETVVYKKKSDVATIILSILCALIILAAGAFTVDRYFDGDPALGFGLIENVQAENINTPEK